MVVLSLFDGMSCGQIALKELGYSFKYYSSEIDKYANNTTKLNFPETIQLGDINKWKKWDLKWESIDLLIAGSPCQGFSFDGKQLNFNDPRSSLFFVFVDILNHIKIKNPNIKFLLENVNMKKQYQTVINKHLGLFPVRINSNLVSAQNRDRLYWTNIKIKKIGFFNLYTDTPKPKDKGIFLENIIESGYVDRNKSHCIDANYFKGTSINRYLKKKKRQIVFTENGFRKLTISECMKLQNIPDWFKWDCSKTQIYKMLGNGWTVDIIKHIFSFL